MIVIHHLERSQSERIVWLCEEIGSPYELIRYARTAEGGAPPEYRALWPFGTAPVISDGDLVLGESAAIVEYILRKYAGGQLLLDPAHKEWADFLFWFHFANGSYLPSLMIDHFAPPSEHSRSERAYRLIEARLGEAEWFAGETFTAADVMMCLPRFAANRDPGAWPNIAAYVARIRERPAHQASLQKAEP